MCKRNCSGRSFALYVCVAVVYICVFNLFAIYSLSRTLKSRPSIIGKHGQLYLGHFYYRNWSCKPVELSKKSLPLTALASFPGSGNTWVRHLLQQATGVATGSVYQDISIKRIGFPAEGVCNSSVLVVKTHEWGIKERRKYEKSILLIRDPFEALLSEFNRQYGGHLGHAEEMHFRSEWRSYIFNTAGNWIEMNRDWLNFSGPLHVMHYEALQTSPSHELNRLLNFLNISISRSNLLCVMKNVEGYFKRTRVRTSRKDPFTKSMHSAIMNYKRQLNRELDMFDTKRKLNNRQ